MFVQEFRCATVESLMRCGIAITKLDDGLGRLLSRVGAKVVDSSDMRMYIPLVRQKELDKIKDEVAHESLCLIFDGTTRVGEALAVVVRYCTSHFEIKYRLIALSTAAKHMTGAELCGMLLRILVKRVGESALDLVLSAARDSCATNGAALRSLKLCAMPNVMDVMCFSHTLHNCAKHMDLEVLESWLTPWLQLMAHSHRAKCVWRDETGEPPVLFSKVRWWSRMECASQIARHFHCLDNFVNIIERENVGDATTTALGNMLRSQVSRNALQVDLAIVLDASIFCEKTYRLEGDRLESLLLVEDIEAIREKGRHVGSTFDSLPNVAAVLRSQTQLKVGTPVYDWFGAPYNKFFDGVVKSLPRGANDYYVLKFSDGTEVDYMKAEAEAAIDVRVMAGWSHAKEALKCAFDYLEKRLSDDSSIDEPYRLKRVYELFHAVRAFDPLFAIQDKVTPDFVTQAMRSIVWLTDDIISKLQAERHEYVSAAKAMDANSFKHDSVQDFTNATLLFWRDLSGSKCPTWRAEARRVFSLTPNSAASERVFSRLKCMFDEQQELALTDYIEGSVMLAYNGREVG